MYACHRQAQLFSIHCAEHHPALRLRRHVQHVFNENAVAGGGIAHKDMSNGTYQFPVLYNR